MKYRLKVGVSTTSAGVVLPRLEEQLASELADIVIDYEVADSSAVRDLVLEQRVELGLVGAHFEDQDIRSEPFLEGDRLVVIAPPGWGAEGRDRISIHQLKREHFVTRQAGSGTRLTYEPILAAAGAPLSSLRVVREAEGATACIAAVAAGEGLSIVSLLAAQGAVEEGRVRAFKLEAVTLMRNLYLISHARVALSEAAERFAGVLREFRERCHHFSPRTPQRPPEVASRDRQ